jgi:mitochondrial fission protein ELM1
VAVLIGGTSKHHRLTDEIVDDLILNLRELTKQGYGLAITPSRRTGAKNTARLKAGLTETGAYIWDGAEPNPYFGLLAHADHILVTEESTNMVTEAGATGKPVHVIRLEGGSAKFTDFHRQMIAGEITRPFQGSLETWEYTPLNETARVASEIKKRLEL